MATPDTQITPNVKQQQSIVAYTKNCVETLGAAWNLREQFLLRDKLYAREVDQSLEQQRAQLANIAGDIRKLQNLTVPVVMPQIESSVAHQAGVFLTGYPIFGIASDPENIDAALQMESVIADHSIYYGWPRNLIMAHRAGLKYNMAAVEVDWKRKRIWTPDQADPANLSQAKSSETFYEGNCVKWLDMYNTIWDKRVHPTAVHTDGEFAGYSELKSRIQLKQMLLDLDPKFSMNGREALQSGTPQITINGGDSWYFIPQINPLVWLGAQNYPTTNWLQWAMLEDKNTRDIVYNNMYEVTTLYGRIIPNDFRLSVPARNQPQIWKFIVVNRNVLIYCERKTNAHNFLPILFMQPLEDGLGYQTKSFGDNAVPFQFLASGLWSAAIASKRRQVFDRIFYDPSRVRKEDIDVVSEVARIPVKNSAYGKAISEAIYAHPYTDNNVPETLQMANSIYTLADEANGQNKVQRGMFQKGNKTKTEFVETMGNANSRQQLMALSLEYQFYTPLKEILKLNMLQYQQGTKVYNREAKRLVEYKPTDIRKAGLVFKVSDGMLPSDKLLSTDLLAVFMQTIQTSPLMQAEFDMVGAFVYWCKAQGAQWIDSFKRDPAASAAVMQQLTAFEQSKKAQQQQPPDGVPSA